MYLNESQRIEKIILDNYCKKYNITVKAVNLYDNWLAYWLSDDKCLCAPDIDPNRFSREYEDFSSYQTRVNEQNYFASYFY